MFNKIKEKIKKMLNWIKEHKHIFLLIIPIYVYRLNKKYAMYKKEYTKINTIFDLYRGALMKRYGNDPIIFNYKDEKNGIFGSYTYDDLLDKLLEMNISKMEFGKIEIA